MQTLNCLFYICHWSVSWASHLPHVQTCSRVGLSSDRTACRWGSSGAIWSKTGVRSPRTCPLCSPASRHRPGLRLWTAGTRWRGTWQDTRRSRHLKGNQYKLQHKEENVQENKEKKWSGSISSPYSSWKLGQLTFFYLEKEAPVLESLCTLRKVLMVFLESRIFTETP